MDKLSTKPFFSILALFVLPASYGILFTLRHIKTNLILIWIAALLISALSLLIGKIRSEHPRVWGIAVVVWAVAVMYRFSS
jgi:ABC-type multidrug transport system permease subunit